MYLRSSLRLLLIRLALFGAGLLVLNMAGMLDLANAMGVLDITLLLVNMIFAWMPASAKTSLLFKIGITLFLLCDVAITIRSLTSGKFKYMVDLFVWIFYIPSQIAITLSYLNSNRQYVQDAADISSNAV